MRDTHNTQTIENPFAVLDRRLNGIEWALQALSAKIAVPTPLKDPLQRLTRKDIKELFDISYPTIHKLMNSGELPFEKLGGKTLFKRVDVEAFFEGKRKEVVS